MQSPRSSVGSQSRQPWAPAPGAGQAHPRPLQSPRAGPSRRLTRGLDGQRRRSKLETAREAVPSRGGGWFGVWAVSFFVLEWRPCGVGPMEDGGRLMGSPRVSLERSARSVRLPLPRACGVRRGVEAGTLARVMRRDHDGGSGAESLRSSNGPKSSSSICLTVPPGTVGNSGNPSGSE